MSARSGGRVRVAVAELAVFGCVALGVTAVTPGSASAQPVRSQSLRAKALTQGGQLACTGETTVQMTTANSPGSIVFNNTQTSACTLTGVIPSGWSITLDAVQLALSGSTGNSGTLILGDVGGATSNVTGTGTTPSFQNEGTLSFKKSGTGSAQFDVDVANVTNLPSGTLTTDAGSDVTFDYDNATTAGTFVNQGSLSVGAGRTLKLGSGNCATGVDLANYEGGSVSLGTGGVIDVACGAIDIEGGTVTGGPITTEATHVPLTFGSAVPADSSGTINFVGGQASPLHGVIAAGWTVDVAGTLPATAGSGNAGTLEWINTFNNGISDPGLFTNSGTLDLQAANELVNSPDFVNTGTISLTGNQAALSFTYDNATAPGIFDNAGILDVGTGDTVTVGPRSCLTGVNMVTATSSAINSSGTVDEQCGTLDLNGGTVAATGPLTAEPVGGLGVTVNFDSSLPANAGGAGSDTVNVVSTPTTIEGTIPMGWTINDRSAMSIAPGTTNAGTLNLPSFSIVTDTGMFTNSATGTIDDQAGFQGATLSVADLVNQGVIEVTGPGPATAARALTSATTTPPRRGSSTTSGPSPWPRDNR